ncbi:helix-turn-helix domain-containing protein [Paenibacillus sp. GXUN7292]|uniref:helix-turn-helix domain-containing protein n=1 Tax=Paenibacillus sp. GXUN7292 TaxID=3422499 RepID=UPI003D7DF132
MRANDLIPLENINIKVGIGPILFDILLDKAFSADVRHFSATVTHTHPAYELQFITRGSGLCTIGSQTLPIAAGDAILIAPHVYHKFNGCEDLARSYMQFTYSIRKSSDDLFPEAEANDFSQALSSVQTVVLIQQATSIFRLKDLISNELHEHSFGSYVKVQGLFMQLFAELLRAMYKTSFLQQQPRFPLRTKDDSRTQIIDLFFEKIIEQPLNIEQLAEELHLSVKQTYRVIQQLYGKSFKQIVKESQIERAKELLVSGPLTLRQISDLLGYAEPGHFSRQFTATTGLTPNEFRLRYDRSHKQY